MRKGRWAALTALLVAAAALLAVFAGAGSARTDVGAKKKPKAAKGKPIVIGAAVDLTKSMAPFDAPALLAAQIEAKIINAHGGVNGRPLKIEFVNDQLDPQKTKQAAVQFIQKHVDVGWVTCDVNFAAPAAQEFLNAGKLTVAPCLGTDELSPIRFGTKGRLGFSYGNAAQDEGAAAAEYSYKVKHWKTAVVVTDNLLRYFQDDCKAFTKRFTQLGGKIVGQESFTQGDKTINNVVSRVNGERSQVIMFCTSFAADQPAFVVGLRSLHNNTPIINGWSSDGSYWWPKNPPVTNFYYLTYASVYGDDPSKGVRNFEKLLAKAGHPAQTGGFLGGAAAVQGIADAIRAAHGSTKGSKLASIMVKFRHHPTISGFVSFSPALHTVYGRAYRVILINNNKAKVVGTITASSPANIH